MSAVLLALAPPWLAAYLIVRWACPQPPAPGRTLFRISLATGLTLGLSSLTYFVWAVRAGPERPGLLVAELVVFGALAVIFWRAGGVNPLSGGRQPPESSSAQGADAPRSGIPRRAFVFVLLCALGVAGWYLIHRPHGNWDAWAIWNLRARFLHRGGEHWTAAFSPLLPWTHPDYPLLLPGAVARGWSYAGEETTLVPRLIAVLFGAATVGLLMSTLTRLRGTSQGYLGGLVLLATPYFLELTTDQYADVPLAFFILASAAIFEIHDREGRIEPSLTLRAPMLAGALTALAAWTKNEGMLFLAVTVFVRLHAGVRRWRDLAAFVVGALPVVLVLAYFKLCLAPVNDLIAGQGARATFERLADVGRYGLIAWFYLVALVSIGPGLAVVLAVYRALLGGAPDRPGRGHTPAVLALMLAGYAVVYLTTPNELAWHLSDSVHRLFMQLWPSALLTLLLSTATPGEALTRPSAHSPENR